MPPKQSPPQNNAGKPTAAFCNSKLQSNRQIKYNTLKTTHHLRLDMLNLSYLLPPSSNTATSHQDVLPGPPTHKEHQDRLLECPYSTRLGRTLTTPTTKNQTISAPRSYPHTHIPHLLPRHTASPCRIALIDRELNWLWTTVACLSETRFRGKTEIDEAHYTFYLSGVPDTDNGGQPNPRGSRVCNP